MVTALSLWNLKYIRAFTDASLDREIVQQVVARLFWRCDIKLIKNNR
jgi:hypothetical protein